MTAPPSSETPVDVALRAVHRGVLALLLVCAGGIVLGAAPAANGAVGDTPRSLVTLAAGLGAAAILTRRRPGGKVRNARAHRALGLASLLCAGGVGLVGVAVAQGGGARTTALAYVLAGAIFALRPPRPAVVRPPEPTS
ncbi:MAG: hypothetical protein ACE5FL_15170 [Myxococcota bacterium]